PVSVEDGVGDELRRDAVTDAVETLDSLRGEGLAVGRELQVERLVREPLRDEHDSVRLDRERIAELVVALDPTRDDAVGDKAGAHLDSRGVESVPQERLLERLVTEGRDLVEAGSEHDLEALAGKELCHPRPREVALALVDGDATAGRALALEHDLLGRQDVRK